MNLSPSIFSEVNNSEYLYLRNISEPADNKLRLLVQQAEPAAAISKEVHGVLLSDVRPIQSTEDSTLFEISWDSYIAYSVRNESYCTKDEYETIESGTLARIYSRSKFLDYIAAATFASPDYPGEFHHVGIICLNHVIDVISTQVPVVRVISAV